MKPISCDLHDYLEIACLYKIQVYLTLTNGDNHSGIPVTTRINVEREECLQILPDSGSEKIDIPLHLLEKMKAITPNTHFNTIVFVEPQSSS
jgi:Rho-binding antiterminator